MAVRTSWAKMAVSSGGTGSITVAAVTNFPTFANKHGSGSTTIDYVIYDDQVGSYEVGTGSYNGTTHVLSSRTVLESCVAGTYGTSAIDAATTAFVLCGLTAGTIRPSDGDYTGIVVSGNGATVAIGDGAVTADAIPDGGIPAAKLADGVLQTTAEMQDTLGVPNTLGKRCELIVQFKGIANSTQVLDPKATFPYTIAKLNHEGSEALTANVRIGSTSVTGLSAVAVTTSNADSTATAANVVAIGDRVTVIFTDIATTGDVTLKLVVDRD